MNIAILGFAVLVAIAGPVPAQPADYSGQDMSGFATNFLVSAYHVSGLDGTSQAPFSLQPYVVSIQAGDDYFVVSFASQTTTERRDVIMRGSTATFLATQQSTKQLDQLTSPTEGFVLPGIVAGEIIAVYRRAISDGSISKVAAASAYDLRFEVGAGRAEVEFTIRDTPQESKSLRAQPTPTPKPNAIHCLSPCSGVGYTISVLNHRVKIQRILTL